MARFINQRPSQRGENLLEMTDKLVKQSITCLQEAQRLIKKFDKDGGTPQEVEKIARNIRESRKYLKQFADFYHIGGE